MTHMSPEFIRDHDKIESSINYAQSLLAVLMCSDIAHINTETVINCLSLTLKQLDEAGVALSKMVNVDN